MITKSLRSDVSWHVPLRTDAHKDSLRLIKALLMSSNISNEAMQIYVNIACCLLDTETEHSGLEQVMPCHDQTVPTHPTKTSRSKYWIQYLNRNSRLQSAYFLTWAFFFEKHTDDIRCRHCQNPSRQSVTDHHLAACPASPRSSPPPSSHHSTNRPPSQGQE